MAQVLDAGPVTAQRAHPSDLAARPAFQAYVILHIGFAVLPILAVLDKFFHLLVNWDYTWRQWSRTTCLSPGTPSCSRWA
jgi:hypothetical protein